MQAEKLDGKIRVKSNAKAPSYFVTTIFNFQMVQALMVLCDITVMVVIQST